MSGGTAREEQTRCAGLLRRRAARASGMVAAVLSEAADIVIREAGCADATAQRSSIVAALRRLAAAQRAMGGMARGVAAHLLDETADSIHETATESTGSGTCAACERAAVLGILADMAPSGLGGLLADALRRILGEVADRVQARPPVACVCR